MVAGSFEDGQGLHIDSGGSKEDKGSAEWVESIDTRHYLMAIKMLTICLKRNKQPLPKPEGAA